MKYSMFILSCMCVVLSGLAYGQAVDVPKKDARIPLLIVDTNGTDEYANRNLMVLARSVGYEPRFIDFYTFIENPSILDGQTNVMFMLGGDFLAHLADNPLVEMGMQSLERFSKQGGKNLSLLMPNTPRFDEKMAKEYFEVLKRLGVWWVSGEDIGALEQAAPIITSFIKHSMPDALVGMKLGTTLITPRPRDVPPVVDARGAPFTHFISVGKSLEIEALPAGCAKKGADIAMFAPFALAVKNQELNNRFYLGKSSVFTFADIAESFFRVPLSLEKRNELLSAAQQVLWNMAQDVKSERGERSAAACPVLPDLFSMRTMEDEKQRAQSHMAAQLKADPRYAWIVDRGIAAGWMAYGDFKLHELTTLFAGKTDAEKARLIEDATKRIVDFTYDADLNLLWFEFNPESIFSERGRGDKASFIQDVTDMARALKKKFADEKKPMPKIFVGTDITTNFRSSPVACSVKDVFGKNYSKIPCPLDFENFWLPEVVKPFEAFCDALSAELPIDGIFLDLEMYHATDQAGEYDNLMDFSDNAWQVFSRFAVGAQALDQASVAERVAYLKDTKQFHTYFAALEREAEKIGRALKEHIRAKAPQVMFGAYGETLPATWFYRGLQAGLSSEKEPLIFASFNTDYYTHHAWLKDHNIHMLHGAVSLLSRLREKKDFDQLEALQRYHAFIWYNRPTRVAYPLDVPARAQQWWGSEAPVLPADEVAAKIRTGPDKAFMRGR